MNDNSYMIQLYPVGITNDHTDSTGLTFGMVCNDDRAISWFPVRLPKNVSRVYACTEFTTVEEDASCVLRWIYMDKGGETHELYTVSIEAEGDVAKMPIPVDKLDTDTAFTCALRVEPTRYRPDGNKVPVMVRSAWLEIELDKVTSRIGVISGERRIGN